MSWRLADLRVWPTATRAVPMPSKKGKEDKPPLWGLRIFDIEAPQAWRGCWPSGEGLSFALLLCGQPDHAVVRPAKLAARVEPPGR